MRIKRTYIIHIAILTVAVAMAACSSNEIDSTNEPLLPEPEPATLKVTGIVSKGENKTRTAIDITDPYNTHPDFSKGEKMLWVEGDQICALYDPAGTFNYKLVSAIKATNIDGNKATFTITSTGVPNVGVCRLFTPSRTGIDLNNAAGPSFVNIEIPSESKKSQYTSYIYMYSDPFDYDLSDKGTNVATDVSFHHLCTLLRFNFWNQTGVPYTIKDITIRYTDFNAFRRHMAFPLTNPEAVVYSGNYNVNQYMKWMNDSYLTDPPIVDDESTSDKNEAVYDALMVIYPTPPQPTGTFTISVNLYDKETLSSYPLQNVVLNCANYAFLRDYGFRKGTRTYFCIDILKDGRTKLRDVQVLPWEEDRDLGKEDVELPD